MDAIEAIHGRRSISPKHLAEPGPDFTAVSHMVAAALAAPDHGGLHPWRVILISGEKRDRFGDLLVRARLAREPDADDETLSRERERATRAPVTLAVCVQLRKHEDVPAVEQWIATGAAIQNMLLAAHAMGFGTKLLSGQKVQDPIVRAGLGLREEEAIIAFVAIGTPTVTPAPRVPGPLSSVLFPWNPEQA